MIIASLLNLFPLSAYSAPEENRVRGVAAIGAKIKVAVGLANSGIVY